MATKNNAALAIAIAALARFDKAVTAAHRVPELGQRMAPTISGSTRHRYE